MEGMHDKKISGGSRRTCVPPHVPFKSVPVPLPTNYERHEFTRDLRSFMIRFDFESYVRFEIRLVVMVRFEIFESSALSIVIRKETIGGG